MSADRLIIILLSPALAFILTLTGINGIIFYFLTPYTQAYFLLIMILLRMFVTARSGSYKAIDQLPITHNSLKTQVRDFYDGLIFFRWSCINKQILKVVLCLIFFCLIEYVHILLGREGFEGLSDPRMLLYSPFYGSVIVFVMYCIYLLMSNDSVRLFHISFTLKVITYFAVFFIVYWILLNFGLIPEVEGRNFKNANGVSYYSLFACFIIIVKSNVFYVRHSNLYFLINLSVILLNTTRGAVVILGLIVVYKYLSTKKFSTGKVLLLAVPSITVVTIMLINIQILLGDTFFLLFDYVASSDLRELSAAGDNYISSLGDSRLGDDGSISSVSRIFVNYFAFLNFVNSPWIGIGQTESYMLNIFGAGIHSFQFMLISTVGMVGLVIFIYLVHSIYLKRESRRGTFVLNSFIFLVLIFTNTIPIYFSLIPFMTTILYFNNYKHGDRYV